LSLHRLSVAAKYLNCDVFTLSAREDAEALIGAAFTAQCAENDGDAVATALAKQRAAAQGK
jgi:hypothetical protein